MSNHFKMDTGNRLLLCIVVFLSLCQLVLCQTCPAVDVCLHSFTDSVANVVDEEEYCSNEHVLLTCLQNARCSQLTVKHKENEIKHFRTDGQCDVAAISSVVVPFLVLATTVAFLMNWLQT